MNLTLTLVPPIWALIADFLLLPVLFLIYYTFPRHWFAKNYNIFMAVCVALMVLWFMKAGIREGMEYHFLGATLLTLMFGWQLAILGVIIEVIVLVITDVIQWQVLAVNVFLMGVIPVIITSIILSLVERIENNHFIIYFFVGVFANAAITVAVTVYIASLFMVAGGAYTYEYITYEYTPYIFLMIYPEAFLTGLVMVIMIVNFPQWVRSFDDNKYPFGSKK
ncbi:MAG: energy-coupling factor ABC transporter permease [Gammaproteobacteria bacterium]|nr:energy-coupling factor ABC transporter permease [Gammaproteobacteria bacterium]